MDRQNKPAMVSSGDIAKMAGRTPAAVSNWRSNPRLGFPEPAGGSEARPLFILDEVVKWLENRPDWAGSMQTIAETAVFSLFNTFRGELRFEETAEAAVSLLVAKYLAAKHSKLAEIWEGVTKAPEPFGAFRRFVGIATGIEKDYADLLHIPEETLKTGQGAFLVRAIRGLDHVAAGDEGRVADLLLKRMAEAQGRASGGIGVVGSRISRLLAGVAVSVKGARTYYDPAAGIGEALLNVAESNTTARIFGDEINIRAARILRQRAVLRNVEVDVTTGNGLTYDLRPAFKADVVVAEPPLGSALAPGRLEQIDPRWRFGIPSKSSTELLWIQHVIAHLGADGRGFIVTSSGALFRSTSGDTRVRTELLRSGCVEAIVGLPRGMVPSTAVETALWIIRPPQDGRPDDVLIVDASRVAKPESQIANLLVGAASAAEQMPAVRVAVVNILAEGAVLNPARWVAAQGPDIAEAVVDIHAALVVLERHPYSRANVAWPLSFAEPRMVSVGNLIADGAVCVSRSLVPKRGEEVDPGAWTSRTVDAGQAPPVRATMEGVKTTLPGDVVVSTGAGVQAVVDTQGGHSVVGHDMSILTVTGAPLLPEFIASALGGEWNKRHRRGSVSGRADLKALEIPMLPVEKQQEVVDILKAAEAARFQAQELNEAADRLQRGVLNSVWGGATVDAPK